MQIGERTFDFGDFGDVGRDVAVVGIVNVTPDSFSEGGQFASAADGVEHALQLVEEGADIIDVGGESSRPGAQPVARAEEEARVLPVIEGIRRAHRSIPISIDTTKAGVAVAAVAAGANCVNDISAGADDPEMFAAVARLGIPMVLMHRQGSSATMQQNPTYRDVVAEVREYLVERIAAATAVGLPQGQLIVDPGIGFGKTVEHNCRLLRALKAFAELGCPILIGASRKSFLGHLLGGAGVTERLEGSLAALAVAVRNGAHLVRVHDVAATKRFLRILQALEF